MPPPHADVPVQPELAPASTPRRHWLRRLGASTLAAALATALAASLPGCGFTLRLPQPLPYQRLALAGFNARSPMVEALRAALPAGTELVDAASQADVVLTAVDDTLYRTAVASSVAGQVREFRLRVVLKFHLTQADGQQLLADTELEQSQDFSYSESAALAKITEEAALLRDLRGDLARQVMRVLAAAPRTPPTPVPTETPAPVPASAPEATASTPEPAPR